VSGSASDEQCAAAQERIGVCWNDTHDPIAFGETCPSQLSAAGTTCISALPCESPPTAVDECIAFEGYWGACSEGTQ